jgi:hypothetical protein
MCKNLTKFLPTGCCATMCKILKHVYEPIHTLTPTYMYLQWLCTELSKSFNRSEQRINILNLDISIII